MIQKDKVIKAVKIFKRPYQGSDKDIVSEKEVDEAYNTLVDLAEQWLSVDGKMPEKKDVSNRNVMNLVYHPPAKDGDTITTQVINYDYREGWNDCLDQCTLAFTGKLLSVEEIEKIAFETLSEEIAEMEWLKEGCYLISEAIHKAQQDKQGE